MSWAVADEWKFDGSEWLREKQFEIRPGLVPDHLLDLVYNAKYGGGDGEGEWEDDGKGEGEGEDDAKGGRWV